MWSFASNVIAGTLGGPKETSTNQNSCSQNDCSDDEVSQCSSSREEVLECPICWESFNIVENVPYVLWCGHTLCKSCVLGLQWAVVKFPTVPVQMPLLISCPWCSQLSFRLLYKGNLKFPRKNFFLLWMVESKNGDRPNSHSYSGDHHQEEQSHPPNPNHHHHERQLGNNVNVERIDWSLRKSLAFFVHLTSKFPLIIVFLLVVLYAIPASAAILALYILLTILFAFPSFLMLYFAYPILDWLIKEIVT